MALKNKANTVHLFIADSSDSGKGKEGLTAPGSFNFIKLSQDGVLGPDIKSIISLTELGKGYYSFGVTAGQYNFDAIQCIISTITSDYIAYSPAVYTESGFLDKKISLSEADIRGGSKSINDIDISLNIATLAELPIGAFPKNPTRVQALMLQYMRIRNKRITGDPLKASQWEYIYNDANQVIAKAALSTSGDNFIKAEFISGA